MASWDACHHGHLREAHGSHLPLLVPCPLGSEPGPQAKAPTGPPVAVLSAQVRVLACSPLSSCALPFHQRTCPSAPSPLPLAVPLRLAHSALVLCLRPQSRAGLRVPRGCLGQACWTPSHTPGPQEQDDFGLSGSGPRLPPWLCWGPLGRCRMDEAPAF